MLSICVDFLDSSFSVTNFVLSLQPNQPKMSFDWFGYDKPITSVGLGHSPEYELALMTLCFVTSPNTLCDVSMGGFDAQVQTWTMNGVSPTTVGSAYILC